MLGYTWTLLILMMASTVLGQTETKPRGPSYPRIARFYGARVYKGKSREHLDSVSQYDLLVGGVGSNADKEVAYLRQKNPET